MEIYFWKNDMLIEVAALKDGVQDAFVNDATVTVKLKYATGGLVQGQSWPLTLPYVAGSDGIYRGVLNSDIAVKLGDRLKAEVTVTASGGRDAFFEPDVFVARRE